MSDIRISKSAELVSGTGGEADMELINAQSKKTLKLEEVYVFSFRLCDNDVDRDFERFSDEALVTLSEMIVGKSGVFDHQWLASGQTARVFKAEVLTGRSVLTAAKRPYKYVRASAYILRIPKNEAVIAEIEGGILKEISVGCAVGTVTCSVCGKTKGSEGSCGHMKGRKYGEEDCHFVLQNVSDVYEWSFVAVPAQPMAGVMKKLIAEEKMTLKEFIDEKAPEYLDELRNLCKSAEDGRRYLAALREDILRISAVCDCGIPSGAMKMVMERMEVPELEELLRECEKREKAKFNYSVQLPSLNGESIRIDGGDFLI